MIQATVTNVSPYLNYLEEKEKSVHWLLTFSSLLEKEATAKIRPCNDCKCIL